MLIVAGLLAAGTQAQQPTSSPVTTRLAITADAVRQTTDLELDLWRSLRNQNLFETAEQMCRDRMAQASAESDELAQWTIRLSAVLTDQALALDTAEAWQRAAEPCDAWLRTHAMHPRAVWVQAQRNLVEIAAARDAVLRLLAATDADTLRPVTLRLLRQATDRQTRLLEDLQVRTAEGSVTAEELRGLRADVRLQLAEIHLLRQQCHPYESDDGLAAAADADRTVAEMLGDWPVTTERGLQATRIRVLAKVASGDAAAAMELCQVLKNSPDPQHRAACVRAAIASKDYGTAEQLLAITQATHGELELARLAWLAARRSSTDRLDQQMQKITREFGAYWQRRAQWEILRTAGTNSESVAVLQAGAIEAAGKGKLTDAAQQFLKLADLLSRQKQADEAMTARLQAAAAYQRAAATDPTLQIKTVEVLRGAATAHPQHAQAAAAHLQAAFMAGQREDQRVLYQQLIDEHLQTWPDSPTTRKAIEWIVSQALREDARDQAAKQLLNIPPQADAAKDALAQAAALWQQHLRAVWSEDEVQAEQAARAAIALLQQYASKLNDPNAVTHAMKLALLFLPLDQIAKLQTSVPELKQWHAMRLGQGFEIANVKSEWAGRDENEQFTLADLVRRMTRDLRTSGRVPDRAEGQRLRELIALAPDLGDQAWLLVLGDGWSGNWEKATKDALEFPIQRGTRSRESLAKYWASLNDPASRTAALAVWNQASQRAALGSSEWLTSKLEVAKLLIATGQQEEAKRLIAFVVASVDEAVAQPFLQLQP